MGKLKNIIIGVLIILVIVLGYLLVFNSPKKNPSTDSSSVLNTENKCFYWSVYNPSLGAWRWRAEDLNEYFPSREDAIANCKAMLGHL